MFFLVCLTVWSAVFYMGVTNHPYTPNFFMVACSINMVHLNGKGFMKYVAVKAESTLNKAK